MKKRLSLLMAALFVVSTMAAAPVVAADANRDGRGQEKVCVKHKTGSKKNPHRFVSVPKKAFVDGHKKHGDKLVAAKFCEKDNNNKDRGKR